MNVTVVINGRQINYPNVESYDRVKNEDKSHSIIIEKEEQLVTDGAPELVSVSGFGSVTSGRSPEQREYNDATPNVERKSSGVKLGEEKSYQTLPFDLYSVMDSRSAYQVIATAAHLNDHTNPINARGERATNLVTKIVAVCREFRPQSELGELAPAKHYDHADIIDTEQLTTDNIYSLSEEEERWARLPKKLYYIAATDVARDFISIAGTHVDDDMSYLESLRRVISEFGTEWQQDQLEVTKDPMPVIEE